MPESVLRVPRGALCNRTCCTWLAACAQRGGGWRVKVCMCTYLRRRACACQGLRMRICCMWEMLLNFEGFLPVRSYKGDLFIYLKA